MVYAIAGVIVVLLGLLIWLNVYWARQLPKQKSRGQEPQTSAGRSHENSAEETAADKHESVRQHRNRHGAHSGGMHSGGANSNGEDFNRADSDSADYRETSQHQPDHRHSFAAQQQEEERPRRESQANGNLDAEYRDRDSEEHSSHSDYPDAKQEESSVEVLQHQGVQAKDRIFNRPRRSYYLNEINVPDFARSQWARSFEYLKDHTGVLGWIAFAEETVGAADKKYDDEFLDALRAYRRSTDRLQKQVGLSRIIETSIVGDEGKVWLLTVVDDVWFALFVDRETDSWALTNELLQVHAKE